MVKGNKPMIRLYSYVVKNDAGFAPNPFYEFCTVATCKPRIRKTAQVGDWILGTGSNERSKRRGGYIVFAMRVSEIMSFHEYWQAPRFLCKRSNRLLGKQGACGDNIYYWNKDAKQYCQVPYSYHCGIDGTPDQDELKKDTGVDRVLISDDYIYWGDDGPPLPPEFCGVNVRCYFQGHKCKFPDEVVYAFITCIRGFKDRGYVGEPLDF